MGTKISYFSTAVQTFIRQSALASSDDNKESITLVWFDPNIGLYEDNSNTMKRLREINDCVIFHTKLESCITCIKSIHKEKVLLIISGSVASKILPRVATHCQIDSIFIFCMDIVKYEHLKIDHPKIVDIFMNLDHLCASIRTRVDLINKQLQAFNFFDQQQKSTRDLSRESAEFLWFQLFRDVILRLPRNEHAKQRMLDMCRQYYYGNPTEEKLIEEFELQYRSSEAIQWYSRESFVYKLINKALRTEDIDQLHTFRFFIGDLSDSLAREHQTLILSGEQTLTVYRGTKLSVNELNKLQDNKGKLISMNGFLSTSRHRSPALNFAMTGTKLTDVVSVLFEIECKIQELGESVIFADISKFSAFPNEAEVLFDLGTAFLLESIRYDEHMWLVRMNATSEGQVITQSYVEQKRREMEPVSVTVVFGALMCEMGEYEKSQKYFEQLLVNPNDEDVAAIEFSIGRALHAKGEWSEARTYYDRSYNRMMIAEPPRVKDSAWVLNNIGNLLRDQKKYDAAFNFHQQALEIRKEYCPADHVDTATSLQNIGNVLRDQRKWDEALSFYQQALEIREKSYPAGHVNIAMSLDSIGTVLDDRDRRGNGLDYKLRALAIREKALPPVHRSIAASFKSIAISYEYLGKSRIAIDHYKKALAIYEKVLPVEHPYRQLVQQNIRRLSRKVTL